MHGAGIVQEPPHGMLLHGAGGDVGIGVGVWVMQEPPVQDAPNTTAHPPHVPTIGAAQKSAH
ncbi:MAG TPA: hypothetical protein VN812_20485 [Candidatus Acidoferrales bacterium]|nr:hypothetical protein [Candidatus Acidoferrales bacterium]